MKNRYSFTMVKFLQIEKFVYGQNDTKHENTQNKNVTIQSTKERCVFNAAIKMSAGTKLAKECLIYKTLQRNAKICTKMC